MDELNGIHSEVEFEDTNDNKSSMETSYLDYNELDFTTEADTVCDMCSAEFLDASDLQTHLREVHLKGEQSQRYCTFCLKIFPDVENFMLHIRNEHLLHLKWCVHCYRLFPNLETKMAHENKHKYRPKHSIFCSQCNKCFAYDFDISQHEFEEHQNSEGVMINHGFSVLSSLLNMNAKSFFGTLPKNYICVCKSQYQSMHSYFDHLKRSSCKSYTCDLCCKVYSRKSRLFKHINMHTLKKRNNSQCSKCNRQFTYRALKEHSKTCFLIKCVDCNLEFDTIQELADHRTHTHKGTVTLTRCKFCDRPFIGDTLKNHVKKVHQHNLHLYKYLCVYCDRIFNHPKILFGHFFSTHKDLSPYTCKICNTQFRIRKKFTLHVRTEHKNIGFVEFDEKFNVYFVEKKSENPFIPQSIYYEDLKDETNDSDSEIKTKYLKNAARQKVITIQEMQSDSSDSDAPLLKICKKPLKRRKKKKFMCDVCNKNCFTLQNFRHHMNLHVKMQPIHCIKCDQSFKSEKSLKRHLKENHKNSKLIETLQKIKERKKSVAPKETPIEQNFKLMKLTLKKVEPEQSPPAILKMVQSGKKLSVQNFFESFKPEQNEKVKIESSVTMKMTTEIKKMNIVLTKCNNAPLTFEGLKMPQKFVDCTEEPSTVTVKIVEGETKHANLNYGDRVYKQADVTTMEADHAYCEEYIFTDLDENQSNEEFIVEEKTNIPEVAEEILLSSEEFQPLQQKFIIPDMPEAIKSFRIGTLQAEAPFYKIIKLEDIVQKEERQKTPEKKVVKVSDGLQLIAVNPLAHLIKEEDILKKKQTKNYYKPIERDIKEAIKKAMAVKTVKKPKKKVKKKTSLEVKTT